MRMMQMLNEHAHKNRREAGVMPKIINNLEENILSAARRLVAEQGYAAVTMRAIAKECGIAVGTFYNYYPSKDAMLAACLLHDWQTALASAGERTAAEPQHLFGRGRALFRRRSAAKPPRAAPSADRCAARSAVPPLFRCAGCRFSCGVRRREHIELERHGYFVPAALDAAEAAVYQVKN